MCGFAGGVFRRSLQATDESVFRTAVRTLAHRGPDDEAVTSIAEARAVLAFRRLSIIDLATGAQPMSDDNGHHLVFNGEIYNYREIRSRLENDGARFRTRSDTEVLLRKIRDQGVEGLADLAGMFGFAFVDANKGRLLLGRDRLGVKQLYYAETPQGFFFASEPKALLALPWIRAELAEEQLPAFFAFRAVPAPNTLFRGIQKLPSGCVLELDLETFRAHVRRYWSAGQPRSEPLPFGEALDRFEAAFETAIRRRLVADVPVGAFLSGGLDSSLVVAGMRRVGHPDICTFSAIFPGSRDDEGSFARRVSARFRTRHLEYEADPTSFLSELERWVTLNDDLVADASCLPLLGVSRLARRSGYTVLLSGEGSDELFGGYGSYHKFVFLRSLAGLIPGRGLRAKALDSLAALGVLQAQDRPRTAEYFIQRANFMGTAALLDEAGLRRLVPGAEHIGAPLPRASAHRMVDLCAFDFVTRIPEDLMVRTDRATMGASIEARVPFLDHQLVELVFSLPGAFRSLPGLSKVLPRLLSVRWGVPYQTIVHRKIGFQLPIGRWFRTDLRPLWNQILSERAVPGIDYREVARLFGLHDQGRGHFEEILWRVAALELWYRRWIDAGSAQRLGASEPRDALACAS
jgi:asparagine synthase (glutamine-hydrolysing)